MNITAPEHPIICRPDKSGWGLFALLALVYLGPTIALVIIQWRTPASQIGVRFLFVVVLAAFTIWAYWMLHARVEATVQGLRWRGFGGWKFAAWRDVQDYYFLQLKKDQKTYVVETSIGKLRITSFYVWSEAMENAITQHTVHTSVHAWGQLGCRSEDVPALRFYYSVREVRRNMAFMTFLVAALLLLTAPMCVSSFHSSLQSLGWWWAIAEGTIELIVFGAPLACGLLLIPTGWRALKVADQHIETSAEGIVFTDGAQRIEARWEEIVRYGVPRDTLKSTFTSPFYIHTDAGAFSFTPHLHDYALLCHIVRHWAPESASEWNNNERMEALGGDATLWTGGFPGVGERIYHYKTRTNRAFLWALACFTATPFGVRVLERSLGVPPPPLDAGTECVLAALCLGTGWAAWRYQAARIGIDNHGVTEQSAFGTRRLTWEEIRHCASGEWVVTLQGDNGAIRFWQTISYGDELMAEIKQRAVNSTLTDWKEK
ncbi:hypothetical protein [Capsulimonas corticalis]|uniref:hypothetical protein n=1 Tax=Capsulimonas corticalis TaxID=2219043 RepID=UPI000F648246|nr:hypothetical protein [Capsulimonas corticalis]